MSKSRRVRVTAGASVVALTGLLSGYAQLVRAPGAYASVNCNAVTDESQLSDAIDAVMGGTCTTVNITANITLTSALQEIDISNSTTESITFTTSNSSFVSGGGKYQIFDFFLDDEDTLTISNLDLRDGNYSGDGGAVYVEAGYIVLDNVNFHDNYGSGKGGAAAFEYVGTVTISDSDFADNSSYGEGGAIHIDAAGDVTVTNTTFDSNQALNSYSGGMYVKIDEGLLSIDGSYFVNNSDDNGGGAAIYANQNTSVTDSRFYYNSTSGAYGALWIAGDLTITDSSFVGNTAESGYGGAIYGDGDTLTISGSSFRENTAISGGGGAVKTDADTVTISDTEFLDNTSEGDGGAIYLYCNDSVTISDSTFDGNTADSEGGGYGGGAIYDECSTDITVYGSSFTNNSAEYGGAIYTGGSLKLYDSLVKSNVATNGYGGGIQASYMRLYDSTVADNSSTWGGGLYGDDIALLRSSVYDNFASESAGGIFASNVLFLTNSTVAYNSAPVDGGGANATSGGVYVGTGSGLATYFSTIANNSLILPTKSAAAKGGRVGGAASGVNVENAYSASGLYTLGSVIAGAGTYDSCLVSSISETYSVATDDSCVTDGTNDSVVASLGDIALGALSTGGANGSQSMVPPTTSVLQTAAPDSDLSTNITEDQVGTTRSGKWTIGSRQAQDAPPPPPVPSATVPDAPRNPVATGGNGSATVSWSLPGYDGGSPITGFTVTASPGGATCTTTGATTCTVSGLTNGVQYTFSVTAKNAVGTGPASSVSNAVIPQAAGDPLAPKPPVVTPQLPAGGLKPGQSLLLVNGVPTPVTVVPDARQNPTGLDVSGDGWRMRLVGRGDSGDPLGLTEKQVLILQSNVIAKSADRAERARKVAPVAQASGAGFKGNSPVKFYLINTNTYLGFLTTDASGEFSGNIPVPPGIKPGPYTLQMNGLAPNDAVRSLNIGVIVQPAKAAKAAKAGTDVFFASLSANLTDAGKAALDKLVAKTGKAGIRVDVTGFVQPVGTTANDEQLSTARARNVAAYLRSKGLRGTYKVSGDGRAAETGATARRVEVRVTYQPR